MYIIICETDGQSRFDAWDRVLGAGTLRWLWGIGWGGKGVIWILVQLMLRQRSHKLFSFLKICFLLCDFHYFVFQITYHSSVSVCFSFLLVCLFSIIEFLISDWVFFYILCSLLTFSLYLSIVFLNSVNILISNALHSLSGEGNGTPLQYSCLENPMDRGAW